MENKTLTDNELENIAGGAFASDNSYQVQSGDTLSGIASKYHTTVANLMALNPRIKNANVIYAGEVIRIR